VLNLLITTPEIGMANLAQSVNVLAPIVAHKDGSWYQTIAYPLLHYRRLMTGQRMPIAFESPKVDGGKAGEVDAISLSAVKRTDGTVVIACVNRDFANAHPLALPDLPAQRLEVLVLDAASPLDTCSAQHCCVRERRETVSFEGSIILPPGSVLFAQFAPIPSEQE